MFGRSIIKPADVLTNIVGPPLGKVCLVPTADHEWNTNQAIAIFRLTAHITPEFFKYWLLSAGAQTWFRREAKQTSGQVNLTLKMCGDLPVPVPTDVEQSHMLDSIHSIHTKCVLEKEYLGKLQQKKCGLMNNLLTGQVRVTVLDAKEVAANA